ncbi:MAG: pantoate--beta-alanine ligase [Ilumatobacteraceae bacterium]
MPWEPAPALSGTLQGGVGTASTVLADGTVVGTLAVVNSVGSVLDPSTGLPWEASSHRLRRPAASERRALADRLHAAQTPLNTTIGVVATSAGLTTGECSRLATTAHDGLARAVRPVHTMFDGDTVFAVATGAAPGGTADAAERARAARLNAVVEAGARLFAVACTAPSSRPEPCRAARRRIAICAPRRSRGRFGGRAHRHASGDACLVRLAPPRRPPDRVRAHDGALHDGHLALVDEARRHADVVVVSIFVNPLQFDVAADFAAYPRPIDDDLVRCEAAGVGAVYAPTAATMYPNGFQTHVEPGTLADRLEGAHRPGHFRGVTTVVTKLFAAVRPHVAVFDRRTPSSSRSSAG